MTLENINKSFTPSKKNKDIKYLSKDFNQYREHLIEFTKTYFPNTFRDFTDASVGMLFIEMASYVGDVLSYYIDYQFKESLMVYAEERKNILALSRYLGYKVKTSTPSTTVVDVVQLVPATDLGHPNFKYALNISEGMQVSTNNGVSFRTLHPVNFNIDTASDPRQITIYSRDSFGNPNFFLLQKSVLVTSGEIKVADFKIGEAAPFYRINLGQSVLDILSIADSDNNRWYEVDYLAQDLVFTDVENISRNENVFSIYHDTVPYIMRTLRTSRKFITNVNPNNDTFIEFGGGTEAVADEVILPNLNTVGRGGLYRIGEPLDPSSFLKSKTYGQAPSNTLLTIKYVVGGGIQSNVNSNEITTIRSLEINNDTELLSSDEIAMLNTVKRSVQVNNPLSATGGGEPESDETIRQNALLCFMAQNRTVTKDDYILRAYSLPKKYGSIAKVYVAQDMELDIKNPLLHNQQELINQYNFNLLSAQQNNPFALNMYLLGYDSNKKLINLNDAMLYNLRNYLNRYRMLTDSINLTNGFIINIGVNFEIMVYKNFSKKEALANAIIAVSNFFDIDNMSFCQPINLSNLELEIAKVEGVQSVFNVEIKNLNIKHGNYSDIEYDINAATKNKIVYPSMDPSIFELKYPRNDIVGRVL